MEVEWTEGSEISWRDPQRDAVSDEMGRRRHAPGSAAAVFQVRVVRMALWGAGLVSAGQALSQDSGLLSGG
jgi:hypothetical protein